MKPYAESCDQNRDVIFEVIREHFAAAEQLLEIGSGTGQHAIYFAKRLPHLSWQTSDRLENHAGILAWREEAGLTNVLPPLELDVTGNWPNDRYDAVFSANTAHIMHLNMVESMFTGVAEVLERGGRFCLYGPFNYEGCYTSESNAQFDLWLKARDPGSAIRDFEALNTMAEQGSMTLLDDHAMPANNRILVWEKVG